MSNSIHNYTNDNKDESNNVSLRERGPRALSGLPRMKLMPQFISPTSCNIKNPLSILSKDPRADKIIPSNLPGPGSYNVTHNSLTEEKGRREEYGIFKSNTKRIYETRERMEPILKPSSAILRNTKSMTSRPNIFDHFIRYDETLPNAVFRSTSDKHVLDGELRKIENEMMKKHHCQFSLTIMKLEEERKQSMKRRNDWNTQSYF